VKKRGTGTKATLGNVAEHNDYLSFECEAMIPYTNKCGRKGKMDALAALEKWGPEIKLDELPLRCAACNGRNVEVRADFYKGVGGLPDKRSRFYRGAR
jgi:hypothetical protein